MPEAPQDCPTPMTFSIIIPTCNRPTALYDCLTRFLSLDYNEAWELIVVNDGGEESFTAVTDHLKSNLPLRLIDMPHGGPAKARNSGAKLARHHFLAFTDDDCQISPDWLQQLAKGFENGRWDALGGRSITPFEQHIAERAWQHLTDFLYDFMQDEQGNALLLISNNVAYRRTVFEAVGGFNESFPMAAAEDMELSYRILKHGYQQRYWPKAKVWHYHELTTWRYLKQQFRYGRGGYYFNQIRHQNRHDRLLDLYFRRSYYRELKRSYQTYHLPRLPTLVLRLAQLAYRFGIRYQSFRHRIDHGTIQ